MPPQTDRQLVIQTLKSLNKRRMKAQAARKILVLERRSIDRHYATRLSVVEKQVADMNRRIQRELTTYKDLLGVRTLDEE